MSRKLTAEEVEEFNQIFDDNQKSLVADTTAERKSNAGKIELTFNYPRTARFKRLEPEWQKELYKNLLLYVINKLCRHQCIDVKYSFEVCKTGFYHMHSSFSYVGRHSPLGLVTEISEIILSQLPKRYSKFNSELLNHKYCRYRCPAFVCQYTEIDDKKRTELWENYISKISPCIGI